jgi:hypothetical protein
MIRKWLTRIIYGVSIAIILCLVMVFISLLMRPSDIPVSDKPPPKSTLPKRAFAQAKEAYEEVGPPFISLQFSPMSMQLPDLKRYLIYYGRNGRPDATQEHALLHFSFTGNKIVSSVMPGERLYILYDRKLHPPQYIFSPANAETSLWMEATAQGNEALVKVSMKGESGEIIQQPETNAKFSVAEKEYVRFGNAGWEIGKNRVDATILARQKARWYGPDLFLARHGGKEYAAYVGKQRIDFGEGDDIYSVFVGLNDSLVWENNRWRGVKPGPDSLGKPLLLVKKIEERLMGLELWDPDGKGKVMLNLLKATEPSQQVDILQSFKFAGARTRTQFVFEIDKERMLLSPRDWLLLTPKGWVRLTTPKDIDDYVDRKLTGPLFVFDAVERKDDRLVLKGSLFNASRTDMQPADIILQQPGPGSPVQTQQKGADKGKKSSLRTHHIPDTVDDEDDFEPFDDDDDGDYGDDEDFD